MQVFATGYMPHHDWLYHIPLSGKNRRAKDKLRKCNLRGGAESSLRQPPKLSYRSIRQHRYCKVKFGMHETYAYRIDDIAEVLGLHRNTVQKWFNHGMLPPPFTRVSKSYRSWGWPDRPLYLREQVLVIAHVLHDLYTQGVTQFRQSHIYHIQMMREGSEIAMQRISYKAVKPKPVKPITAPEPKRTLRHRPAPHLRPMLRHFRAALYHHQYPYSESGAA